MPLYYPQSIIKAFKDFRAQLQALNTFVESEEFNEFKEYQRVVRAELAAINQTMQKIVEQDLGASLKSFTDAGVVFDFSKVVDKLNLIPMPAASYVQEVKTHTAPAKKIRPHLSFKLEYKWLQMKADFLKNILNLPEIRALEQKEGAESQIRSISLEEMTGAAKFILEQKTIGEKKYPDGLPLSENEESLLNLALQYAKTKTGKQEKILQKLAEDLSKKLAPENAKQKLISSKLNKLFEYVSLCHYGIDKIETFSSLIPGLKDKKDIPKKIRLTLDGITEVKVLSTSDNKEPVTVPQGRIFLQKKSNSYVAYWNGYVYVTDKWVKKVISRELPEAALADLKLSESKNITDMLTIKKIRMRYVITGGQVHPAQTTCVINYILQSPDYKQASKQFQSSCLYDNLEALKMTVKCIQEGLSSEANVESLYKNLKAKIVKFETAGNKIRQIIQEQLENFGITELDEQEFYLQNIYGFGSPENISLNPSLQNTTPQPLNYYFNWVAGLKELMDQLAAKYPEAVILPTLIPETNPPLVESIPLASSAEQTGSRSPEVLTENMSDELPRDNIDSDGTIAESLKIATHKKLGQSTVAPAEPTEEHQLVPTETIPLKQKTFGSVTILEDHEVGDEDGSILDESQSVLDSSGSLLDPAESIAESSQSFPDVQELIIETNPVLTIVQELDKKEQVQVPEKESKAALPTRLGKSTQQDPISDLYNSLIKKILSDKLAQEIKMTESRDSYVIAFNNLNTQIDSAINKDTLITLAYDIDQNFGKQFSGIIKRLSLQKEKDRQILKQFVNTKIDRVRNVTVDKIKKLKDNFKEQITFINSQKQNFEEFEKKVEFFGQKLKEFEQICNDQKIEYDLSYNDAPTLYEKLKKLNEIKSNFLYMASKIALIKSQIPDQKEYMSLKTIFEHEINNNQFFLLSSFLKLDLQCIDLFSNTENYFLEYQSRINAQIIEVQSQIEQAEAKELEIFNNLVNGLEEEIKQYQQIDLDTPILYSQHKISECQSMLKNDITFMSHACLDYYQQKYDQIKHWLEVDCKDIINQAEVSLQKIKDFYAKNIQPYELSSNPKIQANIEKIKSLIEKNVQKFEKMLYLRDGVRDFVLIQIDHRKEYIEQYEKNKQNQQAEFNRKQEVEESNRKFYEAQTKVEKLAKAVNELNDFEQKLSVKLQTIDAANIESMDLRKLYHFRTLLDHTECSQKRPYLQSIANEIKQVPEMKNPPGNNDPNLSAAISALSLEISAIKARNDEFITKASQKLSAVEDCIQRKELAHVKNSIKNNIRYYRESLSCFNFYGRLRAEELDREVDQSNTKETLKDVMVQFMMTGKSSSDRARLTFFRSPTRRSSIASDSLQGIIINYFFQNLSPMPAWLRMATIKTILTHDQTRIHDRVATKLKMDS